MKFCKTFLRILSALLMVIPAVAQETFPENGPRNSSHNFLVFTHANIVVEAGELIENARLIIRDGRVIKVGKDIEIPKNSMVIDAKGDYIYPSFIELDSEYGLKKKTVNKARAKGNPQYESNKKGPYYWNESIQPEYKAHQEFRVDKKKAAILRSKGIGAVMPHRHDGIMRGTSLLSFTGDERENFMVIRENCAQHFSFSKGPSKQAYPSSQMGSIALLRQSLYDARWYASEDENKELNLSLQAILDHADLPVFFESTDYLTSLRADKISDEFDIPFIIRGHGDEYKRLEAISETKASFIIPFNFPLPYDVSSSYESTDLSLRRMKEWEISPFNARYLKEAGVNFALTTRGLNTKSLWNNLQKIERSGLEEEDILASLTTVPAKMIGMESELGKLRPGYRANFLILTAPLLDKEMILLENWVNGKPYIINENKIDIRGEYNLNINKNGGLRLKVAGSRLQPVASISKGKKMIKTHLELHGNEVSIRYKDAKDDVLLLSGNVNDSESRIWAGKAQMPDGRWVDWAAIKQPASLPTDSSLNRDSLPVILPKINYPLGAYGFDSMPEPSFVLIKHATVWTNEEEGILENADVCISDGKILAVGDNLTRMSLFGNKEVDLQVIHAKGKHLTSGIIDEHSHIAISKGVNESGQAISAEVRIGDVINPDDINIYRQLAGGVTASQLLHGSANPIGGQSALVKMRWGMTAEEMKIKNADGFIKFALGENVKQSNWGDRMKIRYPQTRMGVEQVFYDGFYRAKEYGEMQTIYASGLKASKKKNRPIEPRRDLELEALLEILDSNRFITCHSYVQSEINMLMHVADSMGFRVNTFTHILEGYKVADKMKKHGAGGSTFSDWWAYKYEVNDAIPYNAALMSEEGIVTAINSDDAEMGRRLNQEAAKAMKYGDMSEEEAWKMVTLNPAILLHLDHRMGSIAEGKDADLVLWSNHPLSVNALVEQTYVDGRLLYDRKLDQEKRQWMQIERARLISEMIRAKQKSGKSKKIKKEEKILYHCDTLIEDYDAED